LPFVHAALLSGEELSPSQIIRNVAEREQSKWAVQHGYEVCMTMLQMSGQG
jgi:hypothetical protein